MTLSVTCGHGGKGGVIYNWNGQVVDNNGGGFHGASSKIMMGSTTILTAGGGGGGETGSRTYTSNQDKIAYGGGNQNNVSDRGGVSHKDGFKKGGNGGQEGHYATDGDSYGSISSGKGGVHGDAENTYILCGGGGGGGGFFYKGMELYGFGVGGKGAGGPVQHNASELIQSGQNGGFGAGGGGGGCMNIRTSSVDSFYIPFGGGDGGGGWAFICVISGGTIE